MMVNPPSRLSISLNTPASVSSRSSRALSPGPSKHSPPSSMKYLEHPKRRSSSPFSSESKTPFFLVVHRREIAPSLRSPRPSCLSQHARDFRRVLVAKIQKLFRRKFETSRGSRTPRTPPAPNPPSSPPRPKQRTQRPSRRGGG